MCPGASGGRRRGGVAVFPVSAVAARRRRAAVATVLAAWLAVGCGSGGGPEGIGPFLADRLPAGSGGTLIAARGDDVAVCRGWGESDRERSVDAGCDTVYDVMSMTKQFTAAAILRLRMEGRLTTSDTLGDHLPGVPADKRDITVRQLLTHTSGLPGSLGGDDEPLSRADFLARAFAADLLAAPGEEYRYSNVGYSVLAAVVEEASGQGYESYLAARLFRPAGMTRTGYTLPDWEDAEVAVEYDADGSPRGTPLERPWADDGPYWNLRGNGGILSTARDMYRWHRALIGDDVLDAAARRELFAPHVREAPDDSYYGYGWVVMDSEGSGPRWHNGGNGRSYGEIAREPDGSVFVFWVANQARSDEAGWDLEESGPEITEGVARRVRDGD